MKHIKQALREAREQNEFLYNWHYNRVSGPLTPFQLMLKGKR